MKNIILIAAAIISLSQTARAENANAAPAWGCQISVDLQGYERGLVIVHKVLEGEGTMKCASATGEYNKEFPIFMSVEGWGAGLGWSEVRDQHFLTGSIGVTDPSYMYGKWQGQINADATVVDVNGTVGIGLEFSKGGAAVKGVLSGGNARGAFVGITGVGVNIKPLSR